MPIAPNKRNLLRELMGEPVAGSRAGPSQSSAHGAALVGERMAQCTPARPEAQGKGIWSLLPTDGKWTVPGTLSFAPSTPPDAAGSQILVE